MFEKLETLNSKLKHVSRITIIDDSGRAYEKFNLYDLEYSIQDEGRTLKLSAKKAPKIKH